MSQFISWIASFFKKSKPSDGDGQWCLIGNIVDERRSDQGGLEIKHGTKHFSPGTKVYCLPAQWGDGYENIIVIGRHRGSKKFVTMIINSDWTENWRAKIVYNPEVLRRIRKAVSDEGRANWKSKDHVEQYVRSLNDYRLKSKN